MTNEDIDLPIYDTDEKLKSKYHKIWEANCQLKELYKDYTEFAETMEAKDKLVEKLRQEDVANMKKWCTGKTNTLSVNYFMSESDIVKYVSVRYQLDKQEFLKTGIWPKEQFLERDYNWSYYYFLQLTDMSINLDKYLDFDYDNKEFPRDRLIEIFFSYGLCGLSKFYTYVNSKLKHYKYACNKYVEKDFDEYMREQIMNNIETLNGLAALNTFLGRR